ncbi:MFS transporter [Sulfitobacter sp. TSTF-M16]|uniref:MFS transporter n=1 Tax=Sulfitobacter aestuariivivens TaxID=2766981 RepID=A0A927D500_9RHOB|nr:MFS transporter [Sulfitobacter aestuariivivens]MBD3663944.1 MFS transporter [Sulfitobacter aestuariivivens]
MSWKHDIILSRRPLMGFVAIGVAWATYFAQMPDIKANVGASDGVYGLVMFVASLASIAAMWLAPFCRRVLGGRAVGLGILMVGFGMFWAGLAGSIAVMVLGMSLAAMGSGIVDVLINARVSEIEAETGQSLMNINHALYSFAYAGAALATGVLREAQMPTVLIFGLLLVLICLLAWLSRDRAPTLEESGVTLAKGQMPHLFVILCGLVVMAGFLAESASEGWSALHLERTLGGSAGEGALGPALLGLTMGFGRLFGHVLVGWMRDTTLILLATLVSAAGIALAGVATSIPMALLGFSLGGLGISVVAPLALSLVGRIVPPQARLAAISRASVLGYGAFFFGPPLMGLVAEGFGLRAAFVAVAVLLALVALALVPAMARQAGAISSKEIGPEFLKNSDPG